MLSRDAKLLLTWVLVNSIPIGYMNVVPLVYLLEVGYTPSLIGAIYAAGAIANTIAYIPFGILADKYGRKMFVIIGGLLPTVSYAIFGLTLNPFWLILASVIGGVGLAGGLGVAINSPAIMPMLAASTSDRNRTMLFGLTQGAFIVALTIGALMSSLPSWLTSNFSLSSYSAHSNSYFLMSVIVVLSTIPALFVKEKKRSVVTQRLGVSSSVSTKTKDRGVISKLFPIVSGRKILKFSIIFAFSGLGLGVIVQLMPTWYTLRFGVTETSAGLSVAIAEFAGIFAIPIIPRLVKRRGTVITSALTTVLSGAFLGLMPLAGFFGLAAIFFVLRSIFLTISWPVQQSYMMGVVEEKERATTIGITYTAWGIATSIATLVGGALLASALLWVPFALGVIGYLLSAVLIFFMFRRIKPPEELELDVGSAEIKTP